MKPLGRPLVLTTSGGNCSVPAMLNGSADGASSVGLMRRAAAATTATTTAAAAATNATRRYREPFGGGGAAGPLGYGTATGASMVGTSLGLGTGAVIVAAWFWGCSRAFAKSVHVANRSSGFLASARDSAASSG